MVEFLPEGVWVYLTDEGPIDDSDRIGAPAVSEEIHSFIWRKRDDFAGGQLLMRFTDCDAHSYGSDVHSYDVPKQAFDELCERALCGKFFDESVFEWHEENLGEFVLSETEKYERIPDKR